MAEVAGDDLFGEDGDSDSSGGDVPDDPPAEDAHAPCDAKPEEDGGVLQRAATVEALVPSADAPGEAQSEHDQDGSSRGGGEEKVKDDATAAPSRPRKQLPGKPPDVAIQAVATSMGKGGDVWEGVERGPGGVIVKIKWTGMNLQGSLPVGDWGMPYLTELDVQGNSLLTGSLTERGGAKGFYATTAPDIILLTACCSGTHTALEIRVAGDLDKVPWPPGLSSVNLKLCEELQGCIDEVQWPKMLTSIDLGHCYELTGDLNKVVWPGGLTKIDLSGCEDIIGLKSLNLSRNDELTGDISVAKLPAGLKKLNLEYCNGLTGRIDEVHWPETLTWINLARCTKLQGDISVAQFPAGLKFLHLDYCRELTGDTKAVKAQLKAAGCDCAIYQYASRPKLQNKVG